MKKLLLNAKQIKEIKRMYWDEGYDQYDIAEVFKCNQSHISRVLNDLRAPVEVLRQIKKEKYKANFKAPAGEMPHIRQLRCKREELNSTKLTLEKAKDIRKRYFSGEKTQEELSGEYKINQSTTCRIIQGKKWKTCRC